MIYKMIALVIIVLLLILDYAMVVTARRSDERAERMYKEWRRERDEAD